MNRLFLMLFGGSGGNAPITATPDAPINLTLTEGEYMPAPDAPINLTLTEGIY